MLHVIDRFIEKFPAFITEIIGGKCERVQIGAHGIHCNSSLGGIYKLSASINAIYSTEASADCQKLTVLCTTTHN